MYKLKKEDFLPKEKHHRDRSHFLDIFKILGTIEDEDYFYLPEEALSPIKEAPLTSELYTYFELVWSNEKKEINISLLPTSIKEGSILLFKDNQYYKEESEEELRRKRIMEKFNKLKK